MWTNGSCARRALAAAIPLAAAALAAAPPDVSAQTLHDVSIVLARVSERLEQYYKRVQNIVCIEKTTTLPVARDMTPAGFGRVIESELRVESDVDGAPAGEPQVVRSVRKVNGRAPKPKDKEGCYDPNPLSTEPLAFLLPANREKYAFTWAGFGKGRERNMMLIDFRSLESGKPDIKQHERGREDCMSVSIPGLTKGRIWIDMTTHDVSRVEERLASVVDLEVPFELQRRLNFPVFVVIERYDRAVRYKAVSFDDPPETMLLPESIDEVTIWRGGGSHRSHQVFSDYKRFLTAGRVVK
jgi:hypothetical protein